MSLSDYRTLVADLVRDKDQVVSLNSTDTAIANAVLRYSDDAPRALVIDRVAVAGALQPVPAGWVSDFSAVRRIEYPVDRVPESVIEGGEVRVRTTGTGDVLELPVSLTAGEAYRIKYTQRHVVDETLDTVPLPHRLPVAQLAAADICGQLQAYYASESAPTIGADIADHQGKSERFRARRRDLLAEYQKAIGVSETPTLASAGAIGQMEGRDSLGGRRLFHDRRYRVR